LSSIGRRSASMLSGGCDGFCARLAGDQELRRSRRFFGSSWLQMQGGTYEHTDLSK
jgi:hypothetical protein